MGTDRTAAATDDGYVAALCLPRRWAATVPGEYTESDPVPGRDRYTGATRTRLVLSGEPSYRDADDADATPKRITARALPTGSTTPAGCWAWQRDGADPWYGWDDPRPVTGYAPVSSVTYSAYAPSCITLQSGVLLAAWGEAGGPATAIRTRRRVGVQWTEAEVSLVSTLVQIGSHDGPTTLVQMEDGAVLLLTLQSLSSTTYELVVLRSTDDGATWAIHATGAIAWATTAPRILRACVTVSGLIVLYATVGTTTSSRVTSWSSVDGVMWTKIDDGIGAATTGLAVWDARTIRGTVHLYIETDAGSGKVTLDPTEGLDPADMTQFVASGADGDWIGGGCIVENPADDRGIYVITMIGYTYVWHDSPSGVGNWYGPFVDGGGSQMAAGQATWWRGALCIVSTRRTTTTISGDCIEVRLGGQSDVTWMRELDRAGDYVPSGWTGVGNGLNTTWPNGDLGGGVVTRSYAIATGQRIQTDASATAVHAPTIADYRRLVILAARIRVASGTVRYVLDASDNTDSYGVYVEVTGTQIRAYDSTGAASSYASHGGSAADYMTVIAAIDVATAAKTARVYWYTGGETYPATATGSILVSGITATAASTTTRASFRVLPSGDAYVLWVWAGSRKRVSRHTLPARTEPTDVSGVPLSGAGARYFADGMTARVTGVPTWVDEADHDVYTTAPRPRENIDPFTSPSPRRVYRMPSTVEQVIRLTPTEGDTTRHTHTSAWILYLAGLRSVWAINVAGGYLPGGTDLDLRTALAYDAEGWTVRPVASGSTVSGPWVGADELVGCGFQLAGGTVRTIVSNSAGSLTSGTTIAEHRCVITLDGSAGADGSGYIWPREVAIVLQHDSVTGVDAEWVITVPPTTDGHTVIGSDTYREIGLAALGPAHILGIGPDKTMSHETRLGTDLDEQADGSVYVVDRRPAVDRVEFAWVQSPHDVTYMLGPASVGTTTPDWVGTPWLTGTPSGSHVSVEAVRSMIRAHGRHPMVLAYLQAADLGAPTVHVMGPVPWRRGVYCIHVEGDPRIDQTSTQTGRMVRMALLAGRRVT